MATATTERPTDQRSGTGHYRAYAPRPFTRAERDSVTVLFGGLHWRVERVIQAVLERGGHTAQVLPVATRDDLLTGREVADIGQCCPTSFTTGNLVNFLKKEAKATSAEDVNRKFVYLTAGSCGACRFGQYHQSYELALRNSGLEAFRMFLLAQDQLDQKAAMGDGLDLNLPVTLGCLWAIFCTDLVQDLEYQVRSTSVTSGRPPTAATLTTRSCGGPRRPPGCRGWPAWCAWPATSAAWTSPPTRRCSRSWSCSGTLFFSFQDLDSTKPAGSVKIRVETIAHYLEKYAGDIIRRKTELMPPGCPVLPQAAEASLTGV